MSRANELINIRNNKLEIIITVGRFSSIGHSSLKRIPIYNNKPENIDKINTELT